MIQKYKKTCTDHKVNFCYMSKKLYKQIGPLFAWPVFEYYCGAVYGGNYKKKSPKDIFFNESEFCALFKDLVINQKKLTSSTIYTNQCKKLYRV